MQFPANKHRENYDTDGTKGNTKLMFKNIQCILVNFHTKLKLDRKLEKQSLVLFLLLVCVCVFFHCRNENTSEVKSLSYRIDSSHQISITHPFIFLV